MDQPLFQISLSVVEIVALAFGGLLLGRSLRLPGFKPLTPTAGRLTYWPVEGFEIALLVGLFFLMIIVSQGMLMQLFGERLTLSPDKKGLETAINGFATHGGGLLAWPIFYFMRRRLFAGYNTKPPPAPAPQSNKNSWPKVWLAGGGTLLLALPVVILVGWVWTTLLNRLGLPSEPQDAIAVFKNTQSRLIIGSMFFIACVLAPINEEMLFRRGLYHFFRQRYGRIIALVLSGSLFGLLHWNMAGFLPLATLGVILALAYERTGDIRVPIIAHGLFNLNTILALLAGLSG